MADQRMKNLASILVNYSVAVKPGDLVGLRYIGSMEAAIPMLVEVFREVLRAGGNPQIIVSPRHTEEIGVAYFKEASDEQLSFVSPSTDLLVREIDCDIYFTCEENTRWLTQLDPERQSIRRRALSYLNEIYLDRQSRGKLRWVMSSAPSSGQAQDSEMSLEEYEDFLYATTYADAKDPIKKWNQIRKDQQGIVEWLAGKDLVEINGEGIELEMSIAGRSFINCAGKTNMPDGEIFTGPVEESVNGIVKFSYPCIWAGVEVNGVELTFEGGKVVKAKAEKNEAFLLETLNTDEGSKYLGELGIGTNERIDKLTGNMLFDEKIGGTIHLALGSGYPQSGSKNKSAIHWDLLTDMRNGGKILVDDELFYESGEFKI